MEYGSGFSAAVFQCCAKTGAAAVTGVAILKSSPAAFLSGIVLFDVNNYCKTIIKLLTNDNFMVWWWQNKELEVSLYVESKKLNNLIFGGVLCPLRDINSRFVFRPLGGKNVALSLPWICRKQRGIVLSAEIICLLLLPLFGICLCDPLQLDPLAAEY